MSIHDKQQLIACPRRVITHAERQKIMQVTSWMMAFLAQKHELGPGVGRCWSVVGGGHDIVWMSVWWRVDACGCSELDLLTTSIASRNVSYRFIFEEEKNNVDKAEMIKRPSIKT